ncbi:hypothetical protein K0B96_01535 [Horticoccus luteus]|uniref:Outer membrane protein with beta-barrel domain n=1 Tax=Horticoccus luteus TaxID=2862869 RepID=A0A8F9XK45_9BACT|nr:hypothetical protein [Horticoccus luteus]QYM79328.1 hypothetical protein K0B96_01535 [Horticoccus luteus]
MRCVYWMGSLLALFSAAGQTRAADVAVSGEATWASRYVFRGEAWGGAQLQPAVNLAKGAWSGGVWASQSLARADAPEVDAYGSYGASWGATARMEAGATLYHRAAADGAAGWQTTAEPYVAASFTTGSGVTPGATLFYNAMRDAWTGQAQAAYALPLARWGATIDGAATAGRTWAAESNGGAHSFGSVGLTLRYQVMRCQISVGGQLAVAERRGAWHSAGVASLGVRYEF